MCNNIHNSEFPPQRGKKLYITKTHIVKSEQAKNNNFLDKDKIQAIHHPNVSVYHKKGGKKNGSSIASVHYAKHNFYLVHSDHHINQMTAMVNGPEKHAKKVPTLFFLFIICIRRSIVVTHILYVLYEMTRFSSMPFFNWKITLSLINDKL